MRHSLPHESDSTNPGPPSTFQPVTTEGFPWTGLTLVLVVIGLIAFMAVPTGPVSPKARAAERLEAATDLALGEFRAAIRDYYHDHHRFPGESPRPGMRSEPGLRWFERQLMLNTDEQGNPAGGYTTEHPFGPYLPSGLPVNPCNGLSSVKFIKSAEAFEPDDSTGWIYFTLEGEIRLNTSARLRGSSNRYFDL